MDNIAFHKTKKVRDLVGSRGWQILFTPPYSPWFNPIENVFSVAKNAFRSVNARDVAQGISSGAARHAAIQDAFETVTPELVTACFRHVDRVCLCEISRTQQA
jgi:transposase